MVRTVDPGGETEDWDGEVGLIPDVFERQGLVAGRTVSSSPAVPPIMLHFLFKVDGEDAATAPQQVITTLENKMKCGLRPVRALQHRIVLRLPRRPRRELGDRCTPYPRII